MQAREARVSPSSLELGMGKEDARARRVLKRGPRDAEVERSRRCSPAAHARVKKPPLSLSPQKILLLAFACAALYAAVLGGMAIAQDPAATETATASSTPSPAATAIQGTPTPTASAGTPTSTPSSSPTQTATPTVSSTPFGTPAS